MEQQFLHVKKELVEEKKVLILYFGGNNSNIAGLTENHWLLAERVLGLLKSAEKVTKLTCLEIGSTSYNFLK